MNNIKKLIILKKILEDLLVYDNHVIENIKIIDKQIKVLERNKKLKNINNE